MNKRPSVADAISRKLREGDGSGNAQAAAEPLPFAEPHQNDSPYPLAAAETGKPAAARTRVGKKFITLPVSGKAKIQFDMLAVQTETRREELMREALRDLFTKHGQTPID